MQEQLLSTAKKKAQGNYPKGLPGSDNLLGGDAFTGFLGEVTQSEFISYPDFTTLVGLTAGTPIVGNATQPWLKIAYDENILYIPKKSIRYGCSWVDLNNKQLAWPGNAQIITILGKKYRIRLMNGCTVGTYTEPDNPAGGPFTTGTEWNRIMYGLMPANAGPAIEGPVLANYNTTQLGLNAPGGGLDQGTSIMIAEVGTGANALVRTNGSGQITYLASYPNGQNAADVYRGWRPVLEYVPD